MLWEDFRRRIPHVRAPDLERVRRAFEMGERSHRDQKRKSGEPFFTHPIAVAISLSEMGADGDTLVAALLHDTVEDTPVTLDDITREFGPTVATIVEGVTKLEAEQLGRKPTLNEQTETLRKIFLLMQKDVRIMVIKLADRLHNMRTSEFLRPEKRQTLARETLDVYVKIADRLSMQDLRDEMEALCLEILEPELLEAMRAQREAATKESERVLGEIRRSVEPRYGRDRFAFRGEHKPWQSLRSQVSEERQSASGSARLTVVALCETIDDCYAMMGILHQTWQRQRLSFEDFINAPMINGYRGLHTTIILKDGTRIRCKIRTYEMQEYARRGVATRCFDNRVGGVLDYLPWTKRISPLAESTSHRSDEFWQDLQSDILGESIVVHSPGEETAQLPVGSTALDGAFYLFLDDALQLESIEVNGLAVPYDALLKHGDTVSIGLSPHVTVRREWLNWVHSGIATATIRGALASGTSPAQKLQIGRNMLQEVFARNKRGLLDEFEERGIRDSLRRLGYDSLGEAYAAMADGRLEPDDAYAEIFAPTAKVRPPRRRWVLVSCAMDATKAELQDRISNALKKYLLSVSKIRFQRVEDPRSVRMKLTMRLLPQEQEKLLADLAAAGAQEIDARPAFSGLQGALAVGAIVVLWGLDPVVSRVLLLRHFLPFDLTFLRFSTIFVAFTFVYGFHTAASAQKLKPLQPLQPMLLLAGGTLFSTALLTYHTLSLIPATHYILFILAGQILTALLRMRPDNERWTAALVSLLFTFASLALLLSEQPISMVSALLAAGTSASFSIYGAVSERYQTSMIDVRYPAYLFWISIVALLCCYAFLLLPSYDFLAPSWDEAFLAIGFSTIFTLIPYVLYFEYMRRLGRGVLDRFLPLTTIATFAGALVMDQWFTPMMILVLLFLVLALQNILVRKH